MVGLYPGILLGKNPGPINSTNQFHTQTSDFFTMRFVPRGSLSDSPGKDNGSNQDHRNTSFPLMSFLRPLLIFNFIIAGGKPKVNTLFEKNFYFFAAAKERQKQRICRHAIYNRCEKYETRVKSYINRLTNLENGVYYKRTERRRQNHEQKFIQRHFDGRGRARG